MATNPKEIIMTNVRPSLATLLAFATLGTAPAWAEETVCTGFIGARSLDNIFVPDGHSCQLDLTRANGNVVVGTGSTLTARSIRVNGNVQAEGAAHVGISGTSSVGGSVQVVQGGSASVRNAIIKGSLQLDSNAGALKAVGNTIGADLQAFQNTGGVLIRKNRIDGNLQCKENSPAPTGGDNRAASKEDQCERL